jgi:molybdopterin-guanine dinucleotide biosynthesis protein
MSQLTAAQLRKLLHENELHLRSDEKDITMMESAGAAESIVRAARNRLRVNRETNTSLRSLIAEIE